MTAQQGALGQGKKVNKMCFASPAPPWDAPAMASVVQSHLWDWGRMLLLGGPQGTRLCSGEGCWHPPSLLDAGVGCFPIADCQGKVKVCLNPAYPVPSCISENIRCTLKQGLDLHHVHGVFRQPSKTHCSGEAGHAGLQVCLLQTDPHACPKRDPAQRALPKA